jgi:hypothetical protein
MAAARESIPERPVRKSVLTADRALEALVEDRQTNTVFSTGNPRLRRALPEADISTCAVAPVQSVDVAKLCALVSATYRWISG